ncbi:hypothetical protein QJR30_18050 (plasmid) [Paraclostridium sordellii]|uniref:hypothetical protein n=1 Tax=Paraclostridium sordellii TaxID=1505 RepID=UPI0005E1A59E|nr:hypothetical protein [Paeniclostridium sordellii]CEP41277.1 Uncharacterised protein [[Clostridium] sordellii] [Paeniclostridium sordellii]
MNYKNNNYTILDENSLCETFGGKGIPSWMYKLGAEFAEGITETVNGYNRMVKTAYSSGKELGSYVRNL